MSLGEFDRPVLFGYESSWRLTLSVTVSSMSCMIVSLDVKPADLVISVGDAEDVAGKIFGGRT